MTDDEIELLLAQLERLLNEMGLGFIVAQERVEAAEGTPTPAKQVLTADEDIAALSVRELSGQPRLKTSDYVVVRLSQRDRFALLLDLVEATIAGTTVMEMDFVDLIKDLQVEARRERDDLRSDWVPYAGDRSRSDPTAWASSWEGSIVFADPPESDLQDEQRRRSWSLADVGRRDVGSAREVIKLIELIRAESGMRRGSWLEPAGEQGNPEDVWNLQRYTT